MPVFATSGSRLFIGGVKQPTATPFVAGGFEGEVWTEIGELESLGRLESAWNVDETTAQGDYTEQLIKGMRKAGAMQIAAGLDYGDPGQLALLAAEASTESYAFKVELPDAPAGGTPSLRLFCALVISTYEAFDDANGVMMLGASLHRVSNIVRVAAAEPA